MTITYHGKHSWVVSSGELKVYLLADQLDFLLYVNNFKVVYDMIRLMKQTSTSSECDMDYFIDILR